MSDLETSAPGRMPGTLLAGVARLSAGRFASPRVVFVGILLVLVLMLCRIRMVDEWLSFQNVSVSLAVTAAAIGVFSAICCAVLGQLHDDARGLWLAVGLTVYSVLGIPAATLNADAGFGEASFGNVRIVAHAMLVAATFAAVYVVTRPLWDGWMALGAGGMVAAAAAGFGLVQPALSIAINMSQGVRFGLCALWLASGVSLVVAARNVRIPWQLWAGLGFTVIAVAHTIRVAVGSPMDPLGITFSCLRFVGVSLVFYGAAPAARRALVDAYQGRMDQLAELSSARSGLLEVAQRDHEVRNSLNVLTSATALLNSDVRDLEDESVLRAAVADELARLNLLLRPRGADGEECARQDYDVLTVLRQRVALAASTGMDIRLADAESTLRARGNPLVLAQMLANVLANCARHAPGSPVRISATRRGHTVVLRVCDFGPGVPAAFKSKVFDCGVRGPNSSGQGFGLYLTRRLLHAESGEITLKQRPEGTGCTAIIEIPTAGSRRAVAAKVGLEAVVDEERAGSESVSTWLLGRLRQSAVQV